MSIIQLIGNIFSGIYNALNVTIPGFHISIANIFLALFMMGTVVAILRVKKQ